MGKKKRIKLITKFLLDGCITKKQADKLLIKVLRKKKGEVNEIPDKFVKTPEPPKIHLHKVITSKPLMFNVKSKVPEPPPSKVIKEGCGNFCNVCGSTKSRNGLFGVFGEYRCHNLECKTNTKGSDYDL